jgi:hypothetical protein
MALLGLPGAQQAQSQWSWREEDQQEERSADLGRFCSDPSKEEHILARCMLEAVVRTCHPSDMLVRGCNCSRRDRHVLAVLDRRRIGSHIGDRRWQRRLSGGG